MTSLAETVSVAIRNSPTGIATLDILKSLKLCDDYTLKTTLSRLGKSGRIIRLKRGVYAANPLTDAFAAAQATFDGYLGFSSALYLHELISEIPFVVFVVTASKSRQKSFGTYEFRAIALKEKAIGFENIGNLVVSTRAKTLFDCLYLERYSVEREKLIEAYAESRLNAKELKEFDSYVERFIPSKSRQRFDAAIGRITGRG